MLPADNHVHSEWSWDTPTGAMRATCARAVEIGLPAITFTDHMDFIPWSVEPGELNDFDHLAQFVRDGRVHAPALDADGYLASIDECRVAFPHLTIRTGAELGEAHRNHDAAAALFARGTFDTVIGSLHSLHVDGFDFEPPGLFRRWTTDEVMRRYLAEVLRMVEASDLFSVLAHVDYPLRYWPTTAPAFDPQPFEPEFRAVFEALARSGRALELNTRLLMPGVLLDWWRQEGGRTVSFGSDSHSPEGIAREFEKAMQLASAHGFGPSSPAGQFWVAS